MRAAVRTGLAALAALALALPAVAAEAPPPPDRDWSFEGVFGSFDPAAVQRGFQVYTEVCAACHGVKYLRFGNLRDVGLSESAVKAIAAEFEVEDGPDEYGDMYLRPARPSDPLPEPFPNEEAARSANNGALPPDLSVIVKARPHGADYIYAVLTGYDDAPEGVELTPGMSYNRYFPGRQIAMPPPLFDDMVEYTDGTPATVEQMSADVTHFLTWVSEPTLEARKRLGVKSILFLIVLTALFYATKRKVWARAGH